MTGFRSIRDWIAMISFRHLIFVLFPLLFILSPDLSRGQGEYLPAPVDSTFTYEEVNVLVMVEKLGNFYLDILYTDKNQFFLNVEDLFKTLWIPCIVGKKGDSIGGFIESETKRYVIDNQIKEVRVGSQVFNAKRKLIKDMGTVFMESTLFAEAFGIMLTFNPRSLTITLKASFELPIVRQSRLEQIRTNLSRVSGKQSADTNVARNYHLYRGGVFDWGIGSTQNWSGKTDVRLHAGVGAELLYGEASLVIDYYNQQVFTGDQIQYRWRWADNDKKIVRQALAGTIPVQSISYLNAPVIGAMVRNTPTTVRKASGYFILQETTEPEWIVELYINNILVDFTRADASGLFIFKVPVVYGFTTLKLKFYGPLGEERVEERNINLPYTVMPAKEIEYGISAGFLRNSGTDRFGRVDFNYGLHRLITIGGGVEYLSSLATRPVLPFIRFTSQPFNKLMISGEYVYGVKLAGNLNFYFLKNANFVIDLATYTKGQTAIPFKPAQEYRMFLSVPFRQRSINGYFKADYQRMKYEIFSYNQFSSTISAYYKRFNVNLTGQSNWVSQSGSYMTTDFALSYRFNYGFMLRLSSQYNISAGYFMTVRSEFEKRGKKGYFALNMEKNMSYIGYSVNFSYKYDLPFSRTSVTAGITNGNFITSQSAQGSLFFGGGNGYIYPGCNSAIGKGSIALIPFLDMNNNGKMDKGEKMIHLTSLKIQGSNLVFRESDSIVRLVELNPFVAYSLEFSDNDLENLTWRFVKKTWSVMIDPHQFKQLEIPVIPVGEIHGMAWVNRKGLLKGTGRLLVNIFNKDTGKQVARVLTESDGYIYYLGLQPGRYIVKIDTGQTDKLGFSADPPEREFTIKASEEGDMVEGIDFVLTDK